MAIHQLLTKNIVVTTFFNKAIYLFECENHNQHILIFCNGFMFKGVFEKMHPFYVME
jgi:hypothetical protein